MPLPTREEVLQQLSYNPKTGAFLWIVPKRGLPPPPTTAGGINSHLGYWMIGINNARLYAHRLAWLVSYGEWPSKQIDHINGDRSDNRITNLRPCSHAENQQNSRGRVNRFGFTGVDLNPKTGRYRSRVVIDHVKHNLGSFDTPEQAYGAYVLAKRRLHPFNCI